ncbi:hypothetical protein JYU34_003499 [Plutella xylostella]|uniref:Elongation factor 1-delta n=1 Tax=Plutella xylostella TaxID=51655 RepID=A0ABQ7R0A9_PLUXY|nr:hypothetical protein JYU34_003499 [Plutella xylostella]
MESVATLAGVPNTELNNKVNNLEKENADLKKVVNDLRNLVLSLQARVDNIESTNTGGAKVAAKPTPAPAADDDDDGVDLFGSDDEEESAEAARIREERLAAYNAKKSKKPVLIAKSNIILDVKPWDDETDMKALEEAVRAISTDGLLWGAAKLVPLAYGIHKLQISCVVEDDKVSVDWLTEEIEKNEDFGFSDTRHETVKVLRPMKDITKEELSNYAAIKLITCPLPQEENKSNMDSLQSLINSFVVDLQENYSATISTVCKTAEKIGSAVNECDKRCFHCQSDMNIKEDKLTAQEATSFSKVVCLSHPQQQKMLEPQSFDDTVKQSLPLYCYSCSRNKAFSIS